ncbi:MAG: carbon starvation protein A, partial [Muribaculaceae bacterium]|nr:carbon starvation protein A [Muribaculaceae bacterium]
FISAMMSIRSGGESLPEIVGNQLGGGIKQLMRAFSMLLLILVGAVFVLTPAGLLASMTPDILTSAFWIGIIFLYYILATLLPVDKLIARFYPVFGFALLFMAAGLLGVLLFGNSTIPAGFEDGVGSRFTDSAHPIFHMMFVSIACGAISGFHATQSPMMARCLKNERLARPVFYGAMVAEGLVALIWAAAAIAFTGGYDGLRDYMAAHGNSAGALVHDISLQWLGTFGGILAILGVVAAPITTGDTALRSARLIAADFLHIDQKPILKRLAVSIPIFALTAGVMMIDFNVLWRYFAWSNQTLAVFTLWAATAWLYRHGRAYALTMIPAMFMTTVCVCYILYAPTPEGFGLDWTTAILIALGFTALCTGAFARMVARDKSPLETDAA